MTRRTDGEKVDDLERRTADQLARLTGLEKQVEAVIEAEGKTAEKVADLRVDHEREVTALKKDDERTRDEIKELKLKLDLYAARFWQLLIGVAVAVIAGTVLFALKLK